MLLTTHMPQAKGPIELRGVRFPANVELILSAIETGQHVVHDDRVAARQPYRTEATLRLFSDTASTSPWLLYTRDINRRGVGFITDRRLPLGHGGAIELETPDGDTRQIHCTLLRCREAAPGWFEGSLCFNREQPEFDGQ